MDTPQAPSDDAKLDDTSLQTQVVNKIPIHIGANPAAPAPAQPTDENWVMRAVGDQLAKQDQPKPSQSPAQAAQPPASAQKPAARPAANQPAIPKRSIPIMTIIITVLITGVLVFSAYSALK